MQDNDKLRIHFTVKPRRITDWNFHTVRALCERISELSKMLETATKDTDVLAILAENTAIGDLLQAIKNGDDLPTIN